MQHFIKEGKNGFDFDSMSSSEFIANANKLQVAIFAYNFNNWFRRLVLCKLMISSRIETIIIKLLKIVRDGRYLNLKMCSSCAYKEAFWNTLENINKFSIPL
ncbi:hypothetical protein J2Z44_004002 [Clostridium punense]|uniref:Transposase DDE domain-containing protein n=1 Tax=Clostridium punense TaxID=1054297 RepID=A0ABS4K8N3_9CLOT|nr:hypothetical protein M918_18970 [Clostridium sp. BL8]MBP2024147.1 hypothetical protein [Clostridium punense]